MTAQQASSAKSVRPAIHSDPDPRPGPVRARWEPTASIARGMAGLTGSVGTEGKDDDKWKRTDKRGQLNKEEAIAVIADRSGSLGKGEGPAM